MELSGEERLILMRSLECRIREMVESGLFAADAIQETKDLLFRFIQAELDKH